MKPVHLFYTLLRSLTLVGLAAGLALSASAAPAFAAPASGPALEAEPLVGPAAPALVPAASQALAGATNAITATATCTTTYTVKGGDNLYRIGLSYGVNWTEIATANSLANPGLIFPGQKLCIPAVAAPVMTPTAPVTTTAPGGIPTIDITAVVSDKTVTLTAAGFPANQKVDVRMGKNGTLGQGGTLVTTVDSGNGSFTGTYTIPAELKGQAVVAIRLESHWGGYYSYSWFYNSTK